MLKKIVVTLLFVLGIIVFGEVPHSYIWENPDKEVTQTETLKRHKDKAELNISVTKLKSEPIPMKHDIDNKKIYFELTSEVVKRSDGAIKLEPTDRIFVSEKLEEVPSVSTTNGRKKINGLKRLNKSLDKGTLKNGNLTWTVKDLMTVETKKIVEINYGMFPKSLYVGITDKDYNLKKIFVGKMESLELYNANDLAGYVSKYDEDTYVSNKYEYDISDIVMWTRDNIEVDIKFAEMNIAPISDKDLIAKNPYLAVEGTTVTLTGEKTKKQITGRLHIVDRSESSLLPETRAENLKDKIYTSLNFTETNTKELKTAIYIRLNGEDYKNLPTDVYVADIGGIYGHDSGRSPRQELPKMKVTTDIITEAKEITVDLWLFGTDFSEKVNYVLDPRNNGTGNLKIRVQDENGSILDAVSAGTTNSVFDMRGRMAKFDFDDTTKVEIQNISGFTVGQQNQGSYFHNRNRWAEGTIPGYKVRARIWSDYDGLELAFEKTEASNIKNDGVRSFKIVQTHNSGKVIQNITVNLYVNNVDAGSREGHHLRENSMIWLPPTFVPPNHMAYFTDRDKYGKPVKNGNTLEQDFSGVMGKPLKISLVGKEGDLKLYLPLLAPEGITLKASNGATHKMTIAQYEMSEMKEYIIGTRSSDNRYYIGKHMGNGLYTIQLAHNIQKPLALLEPVGFWTKTYGMLSSYIYYGAGKRKIYFEFNISLHDGLKPPNSIGNRTTYFQGIPLLVDKASGKNSIYGATTYEGFNSNTIITDNAGWIGGSFNNLPLYGLAQIYIDDFSKVLIKDNIGAAGVSDKYKGWSYDNNPNIYFKRRDIMEPKGRIYMGIGLKKWRLQSTEQTIGKMKITGGSGYVPSENYEYQEQTVVYKVAPFDPTFMWDTSHSSIKKNIVITKELDTREEYVPTKQVLEVGEIYFKYLNIKALRQNTNQKAKFVLPDSAYLVFRDGTNPNNKINVRLSFSRDSIVTMFEMEDKTGDYAGGNGKKVYMHLEVDEYKKLIANGPGKEYIAKGSYTNNSYGVPNENDTTGVIKIGVIATTDPDNKTRNEAFFANTLDKLNIITKEIKPIIYTIKYADKQPLIAGYDMWIADKNIYYMDMPKDYNYNNTVSIVGNATPYDFFIRAHTYQITDTTGISINGQIASAGSGAYWDNLNLGPHKVRLYHSKEFGKKEGYNYEKRELIHFNLKEYNSYDGYKGKIIEKHYKPYSREINQYYEINVDIPPFDPYIYYDEVKSIDPILKPIKLREKFVIQRYGHKYIYPLGTVSTKGYDVAITKKTSGNLIDNVGLRVIPNNRTDISGVKIYELDTNGEIVKEHPSRGKIIIVDNRGFELPSPVDSPKYMLGANQSARVALELPKDLAPGKDYKIVGTPNKILDKSKNIPDNFNLIIGRNKYFKEIIEEIYLKKEKIEGSFTLKFTNDYTIRTMAKFKSTTLSEREKIALEAPVPGVELLDGAEGFLQMEDGDKFQIQVGDKITTLDIPSTLEVNKKEILLEDGMTRMAVKIKDGKVQIGLNYWKPNQRQLLLFRVIREGSEYMYQKVQLITPESQFIVTHKEDLDFGNVFQGTKNNYAEAKLEIENTGDIAEVKFEISDTTPTLENVNDDTKTLEVREINGALFQKEPNKYEMRVNGFLDVPEKSTIGEYKGSIIIKLYVK